MLKKEKIFYLQTCISNVLLAWKSNYNYVILCAMIIIYFSITVKCIVNFFSFFLSFFSFFFSFFYLFILFFFFFFHFFL